jgi:hypothetical protein
LFTGFARLNKLCLAYLRMIAVFLGMSFLREEARYRWFLRNAVEVAKALGGLELLSIGSGGLWIMSPSISLLVRTALERLLES